MGFKAPKTVYKLEFEGEEYEGLEVRMRGLTVRRFQRVLAVYEGGKDEDIDEILDFFVKAVDSWNLEDDDGRPLPVTAEALGDLDLEFVNAMVGAWLDAVGGVSDDLGKDSGSGGPSLEASLPMEPLSPSLAS